MKISKNFLIAGYGNRRDEFGILPILNWITLTDNNMNSSSEKRSPLKFFLLVYGLSIPLWIVETMIDVKGLPLEIPVTDILAAFTPLIAACILVNKEKGRSGVKILFKKIFDYPLIRKKIWFVPIIFLPFLTFLTIYEVLHLFGFSLPNEWQIPIFSFPFLFVFFFLGAVGEEVGYMGYAVDTMQQRWSALSTSIIMGLPWAIWHYPSIIYQGHNFTWILWGTLGTVAMRILIIWIYNNTGKSLFACILFHTMYNLGRSLFPNDKVHNPLVDYPEVHYSIIAITAIIVVFLWGSKTLSKFRYPFHNLRNYDQK